MNILVLGGTGFLGAQVVQQCVALGHNVSVFSRGLFAESPGYRLAGMATLKHVQHFYGDRNKGIDALKVLDDCWDVCIDLCGYTAPQVRESTTWLRDRVRHYIYISAVRAFLPSPERMINESSERYSPIDENITCVDNETYGPLKAACESIVNEIFEGRNTILRPQVMVGPNDLSGRMTYWLLRAKNQPVMLPGDGNDFLQVVDVTDVASFIVRVSENRYLGEFNLAGHKISWRAFSQLLGIQHGVWVNNQIIKNAGLTFRELPLFRPRGNNEASYMNISHDKAVSCGFRISEMSDTISRIMEWIGHTDITKMIPDDIQHEQLSPEAEAQLIREQLFFRAIQGWPFTKSY